MVSEEKKREEKMSFFAKEREIKRGLLTNQPMIVLLYKEACSITNELNVSLPSVVISLLQDFDDVSMKRFLMVYRQ